MIATYNFDSYSSQNSDTLNKLREHVTITWEIIAILITFVLCCGCCLCYYMHSISIHTTKKTQISMENENSIENDSKINHEYTIPPALNIIVPSKSSPASMKSGNYSSDGYDTYANGFNIAVASTYVSPKNNISDIGEDSIASPHNSGRSYKNRSQYDNINNMQQVMNRNQLWQMQRSIANVLFDIQPDSKIYLALTIV